MPEAEDELGYVDSIFGRGTWNRVTDGVFKYVIENSFIFSLTRFLLWVLCIGQTWHDIKANVLFAGGLRIGWGRVLSAWRGLCARPTGRAKTSRGWDTSFSRLPSKWKHQGTRRQKRNWTLSPWLFIIFVPFLNLFCFPAKFVFFPSNALAYAITETFGDSINVKEINRAARYCHG